jgi:hypothetical protein
MARGLGFPVELPEDKAAAEASEPTEPGQTPALLGCLLLVRKWILLQGKP